MTYYLFLFSFALISCNNSENNLKEEKKVGSNLLWSEEFVGDNIDLEKWNFELGYGSNGWGNDEWQKYTKSNATIEDDNLIIIAKKNGNLGSRDGSITSSRITTQGKYEFGPGVRVEAKIKLPWGQGIWPAFWALGNDFSTIGWPACGEIDILEMVGGNPMSHVNNKTLVGTCHWGPDWNNRASYGNSLVLTNPLSDDYHIYELIFHNDYIEMKVDNQRINLMDIKNSSVYSYFHKKFFLIANIAVGGNWPGAPNNDTMFPQKMYIDYIRVYKL